MNALKQTRSVREPKSTPTPDVKSATTGIRQSGNTTGRQRQFKRLRTRALIKDRIVAHGFAHDYKSPDKVPPGAIGWKFIPAPEYQLRAQREHYRRRRQAQELYSRRERSDPLAEAHRHIRYLHRQKDLQNKSRQQIHQRKVTELMNQRTLWIAPKIMGVSFLFTLIILLLTPQAARPHLGGPLLMVLAVALNTSIIPPIASLIIHWNNRRTIAAERRHARQF